MKSGVLTLAASTALAGLLSAQVPDAPGPNSFAPGPAPAPAAPASAPAAAPGKAPGLLGGDVPAFNPGSEIMSWDGKNWNVNNNRIFEARFEKYLNAPEETSADSQQYRAVIEEVLKRLAPGNASQANIDYAFRLLVHGSTYDVDARLCDSLADAVYTVWTAQQQQQRLVAANGALQYEVMKLEASNRLSGAATESAKSARANSSNARAPKAGGKGGATGGGATPGNSATEQAADGKQAVLEANNWQSRRLTEMVLRQQTNNAKRELSEIQAKVEFQALILQFFLQRRFQHVVMATRFYRALFSDGDTKLNVGKETSDLFTRSAGMPPTVGTLDSMANEAMRDVREGVNAFLYLLEKDEMQSGSKRLAEAFTVGEFLPEIRTLPRDKKRRALDFSQKSFQLISALEVKDYALAEKLVKELGTVAHDFDASKPSAAIETARTVAGFKLMDARNAAARGDRETLEKDLREATEIWPRNPALVEMTQKIFDGGNVQQAALTDLDQLLRQKNYRQIFDDKERFIATVALYPERKTQLEDALKRVQTAEQAIYRAEEMRKQNNPDGAWEGVERTALQIPDDPKLNQIRADLTTNAADFVRTLRSAQELEKKDQIGSSLAWYLKAQKLYPGSDFAQEGVERLKKQILPTE